MNLSSKIFIGLGLGILSGLFVGEPLGALEILGDAYIRLLQMAVLPFIVVSLIAGLGRLDPSHARLMGLWGGGLLMVLWLLAVDRQNIPDNNRSSLRDSFWFWPKPPSRPATPSFFVPSSFA